MYSKTINSEVDSYDVDTSEYSIGVVRWYNEDKGYGIISTCNKNEEIFFHHENWEDKKPIQFIKETTLLVFQIASDRNKIVAKNCKYFKFTVEFSNIFYSLTYKYNNSLYIMTQLNKKIKIINLLHKDVLNQNNFNLIIEEKIKIVNDSNFINKISEYINFFGDILISKDLIEQESLKRFHISNDEELKRRLLSDEYISFDLLDIKEILEIVSINQENFYKLKKHKDFNNNILQILEKTTSNTLMLKLIKLALSNDIEEVYPYINNFINKLSIEKFNSECKKILKNAKSNNAKLIIYKYIHNFLQKNILNSLLIESYENDFISYQFLLKHSILEDVKSIVKLIMIGITSNRYIDINNTLLPMLIVQSTPLQLLKESKKLLNISQDNKFNEKLLNEINTNINNDYNLAIKAFNANLINLSRYDIFQNYIEDIDMDFFQESIQELEIEDFIIQLLNNNINQDILKYIIMNFETFNLQESDYRKYFDFGKKRLIYLSEENQVIYLKKLFYLKSIEKFNFSAMELNDFITSEIIELASIKNKSIDFSTFLIIDLIVNFDRTGNFLGTHELIKNVLNITAYNKTKKLTIANYYFDECDGQGVMTIPRNNENIITQEPFTNSQGHRSSYFKVEFPYDANIVEDIKSIRKRRYNNEKRFWGIALSERDAVFRLAKKHNFILNLNNERSYVENNNHIAFMQKKEKPIGIKYCCGQEAQTTYQQTGREFWWCNQVACLQNNIKTHSTDDWQKYTLFDFMNILDLSLVEHKGRFTYSIGLYSKFIAFINRFDRLLERLYCKECEHILYPEETSYFHKFSVTSFSCKNDDCMQKDEIVYLNNCLNGQCNEVIDSRESEQCPNGWRICNKCGSCCSHVAFERRLKNLEIIVDYIPPKLVEAIENKIGHLEKAEYFCYKCGQLMIEYSPTLYKCSDCDIEYDLSKYSQILNKQIHLDLRMPNYPNRQQEVINRLRVVLLEEKKELIRVGRNSREIFGILFNKEIEIDGTNVSLANLNNRTLTNEIFD